MDGVYSLAYYGKVSREDCSLILYRQISQNSLVEGKENCTALL